MSKFWPLSKHIKRLLLVLMLLTPVLWFSTTNWTAEAGQEAALPSATQSETVPGSDIDARLYRPGQLPALSIRPAPGGIVELPGRALEPNRIRTLVHNASSDGPQQVLVVASVGAVGSDQQEIVAHKEVLIPQSDTARVALEWTPTEGGNWQVHVKAFALNSSGEFTSRPAEHVSSVRISDVVRPPLKRVITAFGISTLWPQVAALTAVVLAASLLAHNLMVAGVRRAGQRPRISDGTLVLLLVSLGLAIGGYWILRYSGWAIDGDGARLTIYAEGITQEASLTPGRYFYLNGYGYQSLLAFLHYASGLSIRTLQAAGALWLGVIALVAFITYREFLQHSLLAATGVLLLVSQPDFIFFVLRSSHERITWTLGLLILWKWLRTDQLKRASSKAAATATVYALLGAMIACNAYLGSTIVTSYWVAFTAGWTLLRLFGRRLQMVAARTEMRRLLFVPATSTVLLFFFVTYAYQPVVSYYYTLDSLVEQLTLLFLRGKEGLRTLFLWPVPTDGSTSAQAGWISPTAYLLLTSAQWVIVASSGAAWLRDTFRLRQLSIARWLLWLFYLGFALQLALGVLADLAGFLATNLQLRLFTPFALTASPMAATWLSYVRLKSPRRRRVAHIAAIILSIMIVVIALIKSSNDPLVGNMWIFTAPGEQNSMTWIEDHVEDSQVWIDTWPHLEETMLYRRGYDWHPTNEYLSGDMGHGAPYVMLSELTTLQALRSRILLPPVASYNLIYDNGAARVYHSP